MKFEGSSIDKVIVLLNMFIDIINEEYFNQIKSNKSKYGLQKQSRLLGKH